VSPIAEIRFLTVDGRRLAYEVAGAGSLLLCPAWWVSHLELDRGNEAFARFWEAIGGGYSVVRYDRLGVGVSERELREQDLSVDGEVSLIGALVDALGAEQGAVVGLQGKRGRQRVVAHRQHDAPTVAVAGIERTGLLRGDRRRGEQGQHDRRERYRAERQCLHRRHATAAGMAESSNR